MFLLVDFGKVLCSSANKLQQNSNASSRKEHIPQILTVLLYIHPVYFWPLWPFVFCLPIINNSWNNVTTPSSNQCFWTDSRQILRHEYEISVAESQTFLLVKCPPAEMSKEKHLFSQATVLAWLEKIILWIAREMSHVLDQMVEFFGSFLQMSIKLTEFVIYNVCYPKSYQYPAPLLW